MKAMTVFEFQWSVDIFKMKGKYFLGFCDNHHSACVEGGKKHFGNICRSSLSYKGNYGVTFPCLYLCFIYLHQVITKLVKLAKKT